MNQPHVDSIVDRDPDRAGKGSSRAARLSAERRALPNVLAVGYTLAAYLGGIALMARGALPGLVAGCVLVAHAMICALYLQHECAHRLVFSRWRPNVVLGNALSWINGGAYFSFSDYVRMHTLHHVTVQDYEGFPLREFLEDERHPHLARFLVTLEAFHFPALHFWIRLGAVLDQVRRRDLRGSLVLAARLSFFVALARLSLPALAGYGVAYLAYVHANRFIDCFQHAYREARQVPDAVRRGDRVREASATFSFPLSTRHTWLNALILNFGYHSAHHRHMNCAWYNLPRLHEVLYGRRRAPAALPEASLRTLLRQYHRHRITRLYLGQGQARGVDGSFSFDNFYGALTDKLGFVTTTPIEATTARPSPVPLHPVPAGAAAAERVVIALDSERSAPAEAHRHALRAQPGGDPPCPE